MHLRSEQTITELARTDKRKAFEMAFDQFWEPLYRQAFRKLRSENIAKDMVQEVFMVLWENLDKLGRQERILPYLYAILKNKILTHFSKHQLQLRYAMLRTPADSQLVLSAHQLLMGKELSSIIHEEVDRMPARMKEIYLLKKEGDFTCKAIAEELAVSEQTVKNQLHRAYRRLKQRLQQYDPSLMGPAALALISFWK